MRREFLSNAIHSLPSESELIRRAGRWLSATSQDSAEGGAKVPDSPGIVIAWYAILGFVCICIFLSLCCCCFQRTNQAGGEGDANAQVESERQGQIDVEIARIEANVKVFSEKQEFIKKKHLQKAMSKQFLTVTKDDLNGNGLHKYNFEQGCLICMEPFVEGDRAAHALEANTISCRHLYHSECILSWFVSLPTTICRCPSCRQQFADIVPEQERPRSRQNTPEEPVFAESASPGRERTAVQQDTLEPLAANTTAAAASGEEQV